jgi:DNA topoisomerase-1
VGSADVNAYLREASGRDFTAKDFRTWARCALRSVKDAIGEVARRLGNTPAICRRSYVHPAVVDAYLQGALKPRLHARVRLPRTLPTRSLRPAEVALQRLLSAGQSLPRAAQRTRPWDESWLERHASP